MDKKQVKNELVLAINELLEEDKKIEFKVDHKTTSQPSRHKRKKDEQIFLIPCPNMGETA